MTSEFFKKIRWFFYVLLVVLVGLDIFIPRHHPYFPWDEVPGFYAFFGLGAALCIIFLSRTLGGLIIQRREDFYDE